MNNILTTKTYLQNELKKVIDYKTYLQLNKAYKTTNKKDSITKYLQRFINTIQKNKVTNNDLLHFDYIINNFIIDNDNKELINKIDRFTLKTKLIDVYKHTKKLGVVVSKNDNTIIYSLGLKDTTPYNTIKTMLLLLLQSAYTYTKAPKQSKAKKTLKK